MLTTNEIENQIKQANDYIPQSSVDPIAITEYLNNHFEQLGLNKGVFFGKLNIEKSIGYKMMQGKRAIKRDVFIKLLIEFGVDLDLMQRDLKLYGYPPLYAKLKRDAAIMYAVNNKFTFVETNRYLSDHNLMKL